MNEILNISIKNIWVGPEKRVICRPDLLIIRLLENNSIETLYLKTLTYFFHKACGKNYMN